MVTLRRWADADLWVAVCALAKISLRWPKILDHVCTFDTVTGNLAVNSIFVIFYERYEHVSLFFHFFETLFYRFLYHGDQMIFWWRICRSLAVIFKIPLCSSGMNSDLRECFFWGLCQPVIASTDLWPQEMFTFLKMHAMVACLHGLVRKQFQCHPGGRVHLSWEGCGASCTRASCSSSKFLLQEVVVVGLNPVWSFLKVMQMCSLRSCTNSLKVTCSKATVWQKNNLCQVTVSWAFISTSEMGTWFSDLVHPQLFFFFFFCSLTKNTCTVNHLKSPVQQRRSSLFLLVAPQCLLNTYHVQTIDHLRITP